MLTREFSRREKTLLVVFALLMLFLLYYFLVEKPIRNTTEEAKLRLEDATAQAEINTILVEQMHEMQAALEGLDKDKTASVPDYDNKQQVVELLNEAMLSADNFDISFQSVQASDVIVVRPIDLRFSCNGYSTAVAILNTIHGGPYFCEISSLSMQDKDSAVPGEYPSLSTGPLDVTMTVNFYEYFEPTFVE